MGKPIRLSTESAWKTKAASSLSQDRTVPVSGSTVNYGKKENYQEAEMKMVIFTSGKEKDYFQSMLILVLTWVYLFSPNNTSSYLIRNGIKNCKEILPPNCLISYDRGKLNSNLTQVLLLYGMWFSSDVRWILKSEMYITDLPRHSCSWLARRQLSRVHRCPADGSTMTPVLNRHLLILAQLPIKTNVLSQIKLWLWRDA